MKKTIITLLLFFSLIEINAQLSFVISKIKLSRYDLNIKPNEIIEGLNGPVVGLHCSIRNQSKDSIRIFRPYVELFVEFNYKGKIYSEKILPLYYQDLKDIVLKPNEETSFRIGHKLLFGTPMYDYGKYDYTKEMLQILPTLRVVFKQDDIEVATTEIQSVELFEDGKVK